jgi:hypothetical protein
MMMTKRTALVLKKNQKITELDEKCSVLIERKKGYIKPVIIIGLLFFGIDDAGVFWIIHPGNQHIVIPSDSR